MIRSTFAGFTTAQLAMAASQRALDVTGQNVANINTVGYTKQRLDIASLNTKGASFYNSNSSIKVGYGVHMTGISQLRDPFLDMQYRSQVSNLGTTDSHAAGLEQLEPIFDETTMDGVRAALSTITSSLDTLSKQVGNKEYDTMVRSNMQILLNLFHDNASRLQDVRNETTNGFKTNEISDVNQLMQNIANLNKSIKNSQILGNPALELQDQRNDLLDQLAGYLPIDVKYSDKEISPGQFVEILNVSFVTNDGEKHNIISDENYGTFDADINSEPVTLMLQDTKGNQIDDISSMLTSGSLKGTLDFLNKSGDFDNTDFKGIGYYEKVLDSLVNTFAEKFNEMNETADGEANPLFEKINEDEPFSALNIKIAEGWADGTYGITASKNKVNDNIGVGSTDGSNILAMVNLMESKIDFMVGDRKFFSGSFYDCFANIESSLGVDKHSTETMLKNQLSVLNQTANSKDSVSGVQLDEEGMNLMHFNQSYTAAARLMTTLDEALDTLINRTGVVGR